MDTNFIHGVKNIKIGKLETKKKGCLLEYQTKTLTIFKSDGSEMVIHLFFDKTEVI